MNSRRQRHVPDIVVERLVLGELPEERRAQVRAWLTEAGEEARVEALVASNAEILRAHPPARVAAAIRDRAQRSRRGRAVAWWVGAPSLVLAAMVIVLFVGRAGPSPVQGELPEVRLKGLAPRLTVHRRVGERSESLTAGSEVRVADVLQIGYVAAGRRFGAVLSLDGRGAVMLHLPVQGPEAVPLQPSGEILLPQSYELDDAPDFERFFLITSDTPFELEPVLRAARALARDPARAREQALGLMVPLEETSMVLTKVNR